MVMSPFLECVWKMLSARWGVQIAGMILGARSNILSTAKCSHYSINC